MNAVREARIETIALHAFPEEAGPAHALGQALGLAPGFVRTHHFPDGEIAPRIPASARTLIVYRPLDRPNERLVELLLACEAWRRSGAERIILVAPYLCYMRQDGVFEPGDPISQAVIGRLLGGLFDRVVTVDAHLHRTTRLEDLSPEATWTNLSASRAIADALRGDPLPDDLLVIGPDRESSPWVDALAAVIARETVTFDKVRRSDTDVMLELPDPGAVKGRAVLLLDDICSSGGTLEAATTYLARAGAGPMDIIVTHALFSESTHQRLLKAGATRVRSCDSCIHPTNAISLATVLAEALKEECTR